MRSSMSWEDLWPLLLDGTLDTLYMVGGGPVYRADRAAHRRAVIYFPRQRAGADAETERAVRRGDQHRQVAAVYRAADRPDPFTRLIVGTTLGSTAAIVPVTIGAFPFFARLTENALDEVDYGRMKPFCRWAATSGTSF